MTTAPAVLVPAPPVIPSRYGLLSAASSLEPIIDPHIRNGVEWIPNPLGPAKTDAAECVDTHDRTDVDDGIGLDEAPPIVLYNGYTCFALGFSEAEILQRASDALTNGETAALEQAVWTRQLMQDGITNDLTSGTPVSLVRGLGMLEDYLGTEYGGVGVIHSPRGLAPQFAQAQQLLDGTGYKTTVLGTRIAFGAYPYAGPDGTDADDGTAWLVATGAVNVRRTEVTARPLTLAQALNRSTNKTFALAERTYVASWETIPAAVLVSLT